MPSSLELMWLQMNPLCCTCIVLGAMAGTMAGTGADLNVVYRSEETINTRNIQLQPARMRNILKQVELQYLVSHSYSQKYLPFCHCCDLWKPFQWLGFAEVEGHAPTSCALAHYFLVLELKLKKMLSENHLTWAMIQGTQMILWNWYFGHHTLGLVRSF